MSRLVGKINDKTIKINAILENGTPGPRGLSAYEVWLEEGNEGTVDDYLASIKGDTGEVTQEEFDDLKDQVALDKLDYASLVDTGIENLTPMSKWKSYASSNVITVVSNGFKFNGTASLFNGYYVDISANEGDVILATFDIASDGVELPTLHRNSYGTFDNPLVMSVLNGKNSHRFTCRESGERIYLRQWSTKVYSNAFITDIVFINLTTLFKNKDIPTNDFTKKYLDFKLEDFNNEGKLKNGVLTSKNVLNLAETIESVNIALNNKMASSVLSKIGLLPNREFFHSERELIFNTNIYAEDNSVVVSTNYNGLVGIPLQSNGTQKSLAIDKLIDCSSFSHFEIIFDVEDVKNLSYLRVAFRTNTPGVYGQVGFDTLFKDWGKKDGLKRLIVSKYDIAKYGGFTLNNLNDVAKIEIFLISTADNQVKTTIFGLFGVISKPAISIEFDDGYDNVYDNAFPILQKLELRANANINTSKVEDVGIMKWSQLREMHNNGWSINNHTHNHINLATASEEEIRADLELSRNILKRQGFDDGANYLVSPYGASISERADVYFKYCKYFRRGSIAGLGINTLPSMIVEGDNPRMQTMYTGINSNITVAQAKAYVDEVIEKKCFSNFNFHNIVNRDATSSMEYKSEDFKEVMQYIAEKRDNGELLVVTARDVMYQSNGSITKDSNGKAYLNGIEDGKSYILDLEIN